jgi:uncharacterized protein YkwD
MYQTSKLFILILFFLNIFATANAQPAPKTAASDAAITNAILVDINAYRKKYNLPPLKMDVRISTIATSHSQNMAKNLIPFGHTNFLKRVVLIRSQIKNTGAVAENVAFNYKDAHDVVKNWILSPGHRKNIIGNYNLTGIGIARDSKGRIYYTQIFTKTGTMKYAAKATSVPHFSLNPFFKRIVA